MAVYVVTHKVNDFDTWKKVYDDFQSTHVKYGIKDHFVLRSIKDSNNVTVIGEGKVEEVQKFLNSEDLKKAMKSAGVSSSPEIFVGENKL